MWIVHFFICLNSIKLLWINSGQKGSASKNDPVFDYFPYKKVNIDKIYSVEID